MSISDIQAALKHDRRTIARFVKVSAIVSGLVVGAVVVAVGDRRSVVSFEGGEISPAPVIPGGKMFIAWRIKEHRRGCDGVVRRHITTSDMRNWQLGEVPVAYHPNMDGEFVREIRSPAGLPPGPAVYHVEAWRWCNSIQKLLWPMHDPSIGPIYFTVGTPADRR